MLFGSPSSPFFCFSSRSQEESRELGSNKLDLKSHQDIKTAERDFNILESYLFINPNIRHLQAAAAEERCMILTLGELLKDHDTLSLSSAFRIEEEMSTNSHMTKDNEKWRACLGMEISRVLEHVLRGRVFSIGYLFSHLQLSPNPSKTNIPTSLPLKPIDLSFPIALPNTSV